jgi:hypothetical protein
MNQFLSKDPATAITEIKARLYERLERSRYLLRQYDSAMAGLSRCELGYRAGVHEEIMYLERLLNDIENSY